MSNEPAIVSLRQSPRLALPSLRLVLIALVLAAIAGLLAAGAMSWRPQTSLTARDSAMKLSPRMQALFRATSGEQGTIISRGESAERGNALIPLLRVPVESPRAFHSIPAGTPQYATALQCLTQAIYYEAANEPLEGKRGVAQVVLNRLRHPAFPKTVCGVVYQGSNDAVCQFSFTCDGSLLRSPMPVQWAQSKAVAAAALNGFVETSVGSATSYHADYVLPRWAYTLGKIEQLGHHIFYRFKGAAGGAAFLTARWAGTEAIPKLDYDRLRIELAAQEDQPAVIEFVPGLTVTPQITDRHAEDDVGGRIDTTKTWRPSIPDPVEANRSYFGTIDNQRQAAPGGTVPAS